MIAAGNHCLPQKNKLPPKCLLHIAACLPYVRRCTCIRLQCICIAFAQSVDGRIVPSWHSATATGSMCNRHVLFMLHAIMWQVLCRFCFFLFSLSLPLPLALSIYFFDCNVFFLGLLFFFCCWH